MIIIQLGYYIVMSVHLRFLPLHQFSLSVSFPTLIVSNTTKCEVVIIRCMLTLMHMSFRIDREIVGVI